MDAEFVIQVGEETAVARRRWRGVHVLESEASFRLYYRGRPNDDDEWFFGTTTSSARRAAAAAAAGGRSSPGGSEPRQRQITLAILAIPVALDARRLLQVERSKGGNSSLSRARARMRTLAPSPIGLHIV